MSGIGEIRGGKIVRFIPVGGDNNEHDEYGFRDRFRRKTIEELIDTFNSQLGNPGWVRARGFWLSALCEEFQTRDIDCSSFIQDRAMDLSCPIRLEDNTIVQARDRNT